MKKLLIVDTDFKNETILLELDKIKSEVSIFNALNSYEIIYIINAPKILNYIKNNKANVLIKNSDVFMKIMNLFSNKMIAKKNASEVFPNNHMLFQKSKILLSQQDKSDFVSSVGVNKKRTAEDILKILDSFNIENISIQVEENIDTIFNLLEFDIMKIK